MSKSAPAAGTPDLFGSGAGEAELMAAITQLIKITASSSDYPLATKKKAKTAYLALYAVVETLYPYRTGTL